MPKSLNVNDLSRARKIHPQRTVARRQRVLLHVFPGFNVGGSQVRTATLANELGRKYTHLIVSLDGTSDCCNRLDSKVDYLLIEQSFDKRSGLRNLWKFRRCLNLLRPDVLITYNWGAVEWALANFFRQCPHLHIEDGFGPDEVDHQIRRRVLFRRWVLSRSQRVVVPSRTLYRIATDIWKLAPGRVQYLPNGIAPEAFRCEPDPAVRGHFPNSGANLLIGTVAVLRPEKNLQRLLRAFQQVNRAVPEARLVIAGDGSERLALEKMAAQLKLADVVWFPGHVARPESLYRALDLFVLSSDTEQMPYSVLEAMAAGLPVASVDVGDVREMLATDNGRFVVPKDDGQLADAMIELLRDPGRRDRLGHRNRQRLEARYSQDQMLKAYDQLFGA